MAHTLVVDDDRAFHAFCRSLPPGEGEATARFTFAASDAEAVEILQAAPALDLALVSLDSPRISGMALFQQLGASRVRIPRIALTGRHDLGLIRHAMNQGAADFLVKPVSREDLQRTIHKVCRETERRRAAWRNEAQLSALRREIDLAGDIQRRILPGPLPPGGGVALHAHTAPAREMGGDFYDYFPVGPHHLALVVADVVGKGIPAAFFMAVAHTLLRATVLRGGSPGDCLAHANTLLCRHNIPAMLVSVFLGVLDTASGALTYANGGHLPPLLLPADGGPVVPVHGGEGVIIGVQEGLDYPSGRMTLAPGDTLLLYTDGVTEAFNPQREQFSEARLMACLEAGRGLAPAALTAELLAAVAAHAGEADPSDDLTCLVLQRP